MKPLHSSAIGKIVLASLPLSERAKVIRALPRPRFTTRTLCATAQLLADLGEGLARGYQLTRGENVADVMGVAMPVVVEGDLFGMCVAGPMHRMEAAHAGHADVLKRALASLE